MHRHGRRPSLASEDISTAQLVHCARGCGLKAKAVTLDWSGLTKLGNALPAILRLKNGAFLLIESLESNDERAIAGLRDPKSSSHAGFFVDRPHLEEAWGGEVILLRRDYDIADEEQPFSFGLIDPINSADNEGTGIAWGLPFFVFDQSIIRSAASH